MSRSVARGIGASSAVVLSASLLAATLWANSADAAMPASLGLVASDSASALPPTPTVTPTPSDSSSPTTSATSAPTPTPSASATPTATAVATTRTVTPAATRPRARSVALVIPYRYGTKKYSQFYARHFMWRKYHWGRVAFKCLVRLWERESHWNRFSHNRSGAHGIPQALPGHKMARMGRDWRNNPRTQIRWGLAYIKGKYGNPIRAWRHFRSHRWY